MAKLTKQQRKAHAEAEAILTKDRITDDERDFVFQNWHEGATHENGAAGAFFTPFGLACDFALDGAGRRVIDLCAGIGVLSYIVHHRSKWGERLTDLTCVEINPRYVAVGRKLLPQARWINADVFDWRTLDLGHYDVAIANPPFGRVSRSGDAPRYRGPEFEFHVMDIAREVAERGCVHRAAGVRELPLFGAPMFRPPRLRARRRLRARDRRLYGHRRGRRHQFSPRRLEGRRAPVRDRLHRLRGGARTRGAGQAAPRRLCVPGDAARRANGAAVVRERRAEALARGNPAPRSPRPLPTPRRRPSIPDAPNIRLPRRALSQARAAFLSATS